jgi:hypothetical protein
MIMGSLLTRDNNTALESGLNKKSLTATDSYMANFLGAGGATEFLKGMQKNPNADAASMLPSAAYNNPNIFYKDGQPLTFEQIYDNFSKKMHKFEYAGAKPKPSNSYKYNSAPNSLPNHTMQTPMRSPKSPQTPVPVMASYNSGSTPMPDINGIPIHIFDNGLMVTNTYSA